jgi:hypothetical protein
MLANVNLKFHPQGRFFKLLFFGRNGESALA